MAIKALLFLRGWWRISWHRCPQCNSAAPEVDDCPVCEGWTQALTGLHRPPWYVVERWADRFFERLRNV